MKIRQMYGKFIIYTTIFTLGSIFSIWLLWQRVLLLTIVLILLAVMELKVIGSKKLMIVYPIIIFGGVLTEVVAVYLGAWHYTLPSFWGVPPVASAGMGKCRNNQYLRLQTNWRVD